MIIYRTQFNLTDKVKDFDQAFKFLMENNVKKYMQYDKRRISSETYEKITKFEYILTSLTDGYIEMITSDELSEIELQGISDWLKGQNSDGLGASFSEQDFACYQSDELINVDGNLENATILSEFSSKDTYEFEQV